MPEVRASIIVDVKGDTAAANLKKVGDAGNKLGTDLKQGLGGAVQAATGLNIASLSLAGGITALGVGLKYAVDQAAEAEKIMAQTEAVVKSTGGAAGLTAEQIGAMAGRLSQLSAVDDELVQSGANVLLTFKAVKSDAFEPAMQAALDMSVALKTDLKGAVIQIGKALEDPVRGLTALRRSGVSFTAEQQSVIKALVATGKSAEAQALILEELNKQFGGSAAAAAKTYSGQLALLKINVDNLAQAIGQELLPTLTKATGALNLLLTWDEKVTAALVEHEANVLATADSYEAYRAEIIRARLASGEYAQQTEITSRGVRRWAADTGLLTEAQFLARTESSEATRAADRQASAQYEAAKSAEASAARYQGLADALGATTAANYDLAKATDAATTSAKLAAGLAGSLTQAQDDYRAVLAETGPEIERLTAEIARYEAAQGKTWTVTTAATASIEEYELAQIRSAQAAQKLAEFTGDNREEYLQLKIAADNAAEKVGALGAEMGLSQTFTADYTKTIMELNGELDANISKNLIAAEAMKVATAEFLYQQIAADLDAKAQLALARELGLLSEADYLAATAAQTLTQSYKDNLLELPGLIGATGALRDTINSLQSRNIEINISTFYHEYRQQAGTAPGPHEGDYGAAGEGSYNNGGVVVPPDDNRDNRAMGGNFIVPPGYPNDSYRMGVQSGERVQVTPADQRTLDPADILAMLPGMLERAMSSALARSGRA